VITDTAPNGVTLRISLFRSRYCATSNSLLWLSASNSEAVNRSNYNRCVATGAYSCSAWEYVRPAVGWQWTPGSDSDTPAFRMRVTISSYDPAVLCMEYFDVNTSLSSVPDTLHVQKLECHEIGTNLFRKNFHDADVFNIIG
jgi:hypothetical protein